jgi:hypothetical protein
LTYPYFSSYEEPKPIKLGNLKRANTQVKPGIDAGVGRKKSLIAPLAENKADDSPLRPDSLLDNVYMLNIDNSLAVKRATGRRVDPVTGKLYHLEFNPPPISELVSPLCAENLGDDLNGGVCRDWQKDYSLFRKMHSWTARFCIII